MSDFQAPDHTDASGTSTDVTELTHDEAKDLSTGALVEALQNGAIAQDGYLSVITEQRDEAEQRGRESKESGFHEWLRVVVQRKQAQMPEETPRQVRVSGSLAGMPGRGRRQDETEEEYFNSMRNVTMHFSDFVKFFANAALPVLRLAQMVKQVRIADLPSKYDNGTYSRTIGYLDVADDSEPVAIQLSRMGDTDAGWNCIELAKSLCLLLEQAQQDDTIPETPYDFRINTGEPQAFTPTESEPSF